MNVQNYETPRSFGGGGIYRNIDLGIVGQVVKAQPGQVYGWHIVNQAAAARYVKIYNKATAATNGDTPVMTIPLPAGSGSNIHFGTGIPFSAGISMRASNLIADADNTATTANDVVVNVLFF